LGLSGSVWDEEISEKGLSGEPLCQASSKSRSKASPIDAIFLFTMKMKKSKFSASLALAAGMLAGLSDSNAALIASLDYGVNTAVQSGFTFAGNNSAVTVGGVTVTTAGFTGAQNPGDAALTGNPMEDLYRDYLYGGNSTVTISGLAANTQHTITIHAYAGGNTNNFSTTWYVGDNTSTNNFTWTQAANGNNPFPAATSVFDLTATSNASGVILLTAVANVRTSRLNGLEIAVIPEPATALLGGLGLLALLRRRR
jgi:hypothetical protein